MQKTATYKIITLGLLFIVMDNAGITIQSDVEFPELEFQYNWQSRLIDIVGNLVFRKIDYPFKGCNFKTVNAELKQELATQLPILTEAWKQRAPLLFNQVFSCFKRGFKKPKRSTIIYLGQDASYGSSRFLILGLRRFIEPKPYAWITSREDSFIDLVFHELLHIWIDDNVNIKRSALLTKYSCENSHVRDHIHLMAIQKMVYLKLHRQDLLDMIDEAYRKFSPPAYQRAWEIVNNIEGYKAILEDVIVSLN